MMPAYQYKCENDHETELTHSIAECDAEHRCPQCDAMMSRVPAFREAFFFGPDFSCNSHVARANIGRNPSNQNRYSK